MQYPPFNVHGRTNYGHCVSCIALGFILLTTLLLSPAQAVDWAETVAHCSACHDTKRICSKLDRNVAYWTDTVINMKRIGAKLSEAQEESIVMLLAGKADVDPAPLFGCMTPATSDIPTAQSATVPLLARLMHPALMVFTLLLALRVAYQGINRARFTLLKHKAAFNWKWHVKYGLVVITLWCLGMAAGSFMTNLVHGAMGITGLHRTIAFTMLPLIIFGAGSGLYMDKKKQPRKLLPILHGAANLILLALAASQLVTGFKLVRALF